MYKFIVKPFFDFILALVLLILSSPVLIITYMLIWVVEKHNPIFFQVRPGYKGKPFTILKFKTMTDKKDLNNVLLSEEKRLTPLGKFIRKTSIDELPQLFNVLKGDISLVGPRPLLVEYLSLYSKEQARRHIVKPGITGWAQVNGRNTISWKKKFEYDVWYVDNLSFFLDLKVLFLTFFKVLKKEGVNRSEKVTMVRFDGTN